MHFGPLDTGNKHVMWTFSEQVTPWELRSLGRKGESGEPQGAETGAAAGPPGVPRVSARQPGWGFGWVKVD